MSIFVSIASYRDIELVPTIRHCIQQARYPNDLRFGICWQHGSDEDRPVEFEDRRFRVPDVLWHQSRGACWARSEIMKLWSGEEYYLQLDSHHRFTQDWDRKLLHHVAMTEAPKPVLSTYPASFNPSGPLPDSGHPNQLNFSRFNNDGIPVFVPRAIPDWRDLRRPPRARFVAGGFLFSIGSFVKDVPYDPELYFMGEEITLAIRAFTRGYELFHPPEHVLWHEYIRVHGSKHWHDHSTLDHVDIPWHRRDKESKKRIRQLLTASYVGRFGYGTVRSFTEYEAYAGLSFKHEAAQDATIRGIEPPNPPMAADWASNVRDWNVRIEIDRGAMQSGALTDPKFWYVGVHDLDKQEIHREDAGVGELRRLLTGTSSKIVIERKFRSARQPVTWTVWPVNAAGSWLATIVGDVNDPVPTAPNI
jgi:hypothetical protein